MPELISIAGSDLVKNSRAAINNNFKTVACDFAGSAFPVVDVAIGTSCYRVDQKKVYRYIDDGVWRLETDLSGSATLVAEAAHSERATSDIEGNRINIVYAKNSSLAAVAKSGLFDDLKDVPTFVKTVNNIQPDSMGNTIIDVGVKSINGQTGDANIDLGVYVKHDEVDNRANKIPKYNSEGHLVLPNGSEFWIA